MELKIAVLACSILILVFASAHYYLYLKHVDLVKKRSSLVEQNTILKEALKKAETLHFEALTELQKLKSSPPRTDSYELSEFMRDMINGKALIEVKRIEPSSVFLRSVRE